MAPRKAVRRATPAKESGVNGLPMMSMNMAAAPSAPVRFPSRTSTSKVSRSPSSFGVFSTTTASRIAEPSLLNADTVAFGGSFAKLSVPIAQSSMMWLVVSCPAARTGRSAKTIEFGATPVSTSLFPCKLTPCELRTIREGTTSGLVTPPIVFCSGTCGGAGGAVWASAIPDVQSTLTTVTTIKGTRVT